MRSALLLIVLQFAVVVAVLGALVRHARGDRDVARSDHATLLLRRTVRWRWIGLAAGTALAAVAVTADEPLGRGLALATPLFGIGALLGVLIGELRLPAPPAGERRALVEVRRVRDHLPRGLTAVVTVATALLTTGLLAAGLAGSPDDLGRAGRALVHVSGASTQTRTPWPGSFYGVPLAIAVGIGLLLAAVTMRRIVGRPRQVSEVTTDDALRRRSGATVVAAVGVLVAVPLAGVSLFASVALHGLQHPPTGAAPLGWLSVAAIVFAIVVVTWSTSTLLSPGAHARIHARGRARTTA